MSIYCDMEHSAYPAGCVRGIQQMVQRDQLNGDEQPLVLAEIAPTGYNSRTAPWQRTERSDRGGKVKTTPTILPEGENFTSRA